MCEYHFLNVCCSGMNLNTGGRSGTMKRPAFCFLNTGTHLYHVSCPACCTHTRLAGQEVRTVAGHCSADQLVFPPVWCTNITTLTLKCNQIMQNTHRASLLSLFVHSPSVPLSLCQSSWCLKVQMWCLAGTVSGKKESSGKWSCFESLSGI